MKERKETSKTTLRIKTIVKKINSLKDPETRKIKNFINKKYNLSDVHISVYLYPKIKKLGGFKIIREESKYYFRK